MLPDIVPVILAGGEGRRLRPLTRTTPKPFLKLFGGQSLLQMTLHRASGFGRPVIVCHENHAADAQREALEAGFNAEILAEPLQRGTAAAVISAAFKLYESNPLMLVMPSDHVILDEAAFRETVRQAAGMDGLVILGKTPENGQSRYGYIHTKDGALQSFTEKPDAKIAKRLAATPGVYWNTGIFLCRARKVLELFANHAPDVFENAGRAMAGARIEGEILRPQMRGYAAIPSLSVDHALMERLHEGRVCPLETDWHDVGCWERVLALKLSSLARRATGYEHRTSQQRSTA